MSKNLRSIDASVLTMPTQRDGVHMSPLARSLGKYANTIQLKEDGHRRDNPTRPPRLLSVYSADLVGAARTGKTAID